MCHIWPKPQEKFFTSFAAKISGKVSDQAQLSPVKTQNLPDICPMTDCYLQPHIEFHTPRAQTTP